ncbi:hypothetical protein LWI29_012757 [Acer saccharum]|uniref:Pollen Ole e 1 allergen and extensin family protein n=1 Tax=Acer saccharum TaxID=4024 RepID=A0AA39SS88_ACESA|nr:hypothetical protein LWI29_012757 [Acer saccharum]
MSYFSGCNTWMFKSMSFLMIIIIFVFFLLLQAPSISGTGDHGDRDLMINPLYESSTREEMVQVAGYGEEKLSTVLVTGTVFCEACLHGQTHLRAWPISGALVTVYCHSSHRKTITRTQAFTDEYGDFIIDLPSDLHAVPNLDKSCSVKVHRVPKNTLCRPAHVKKHIGLTLSSVGNGIRTYEAEEIRLLHLTSKPLRACTGKGSSDKQIAW